MNCTTYNIRGLAGARKRRALRCYLKKLDPQILLLQETMIPAHDAISIFLQIRPHWRVTATDALGLSGGTLTAWNPEFGDFQAFITFAGILLKGTIRGFKEPIQVLNIYGPCRDRLSFWRHVDELNLLAHNNLIVGGDLNFTLSLSETWGGTATGDPLADYLRRLLIRVDLVDISLDVSGPTWRNGRSGSAYVAKRLDRFLVSGSLIDHFGRYRTWSSPDTASDHLPVTLQVTFQFHKVLYPFKFNKIWLKDEHFMNDVEQYWCTLCFTENCSHMDAFLRKLSLIKRFVIKWINKKKKGLAEELSNVENEITELLNLTISTSPTTADLERLRILNDRHDHILLIQEETWRLKSRALWLEAGDKNTKYFHAYANHRRNRNSIWNLRDSENDSVVTSQKDLEKVAYNHFKEFYQASPSEI